MTARSKCGEWQSRWSEKLLQADVAGADDIEPGEIVDLMARKSDASSIQHLEKVIANQAELLDLVE
jgi:hypothetical protein